MATAIAGVSASEVSSLGIPLSTKFKTFVQSLPVSEVYIPMGGSAKKYGLAPGAGHGRDRYGVLVGPEYKQQSGEEVIAAADDSTQKELPTNTDDTTQVEAAVLPNTKNVPTDDNQNDELAQTLTSQEQQLVNGLMHQTLRGAAEPQPQFQFQQPQHQHLTAVAIQPNSVYNPYQPQAYASPYTLHYNWPVADQQAAVGYQQGGFQRITTPPQYEPQLPIAPYGYYDQRGAYAAAAVPQQFYPFAQQQQFAYAQQQQQQFGGHQFQ